MQQQKGFNPILGETFQAKIGNTHYYSEQVSHHPPVFCFYVFNPKFKIYGYNDLEAVTGANSVTCTCNAITYLQFSDGDKYTITNPTVSVTGTMVGRRYVNYIGNIRITDLVIFISNFRQTN